MLHQVLHCTALRAVIGNVWLLAKWCSPTIWTNPLNREPKQRPTAVQLLDHPFITQQSSDDCPDTPLPKDDAKAWRRKKEIQSLVSLSTSTAEFFRLPKTLTLRIFSFLAVRDIDSLAQVCKYWNILVPHPSLSSLSQFTQRPLCILRVHTRRWNCGS
jgi:serine/threonine protein kinase